MTEIIFEVIGIVLLLVIGFCGGFMLGEVAQLKKQTEKNEAEVVVILIDGSDKDDRRTDY